MEAGLGGSDYWEIDQRLACTNEVSRSANEDLGSSRYLMSRRNSDIHNDIDVEAI